MKKIGYIVLVAMVAMTFSGIAWASDKVGYVDPIRVLASHPKYEASQKTLEKAAQTKAEATKKAVDKEKDSKKKMAIYEAAKRESMLNEQKVMNPIMKDINAAIASVAKKKSVTIVLNKSLVFLGGIDLTDDVVKILKK